MKAELTVKAPAGISHTQQTNSALDRDQDKSSAIYRSPAPVQMTSPPITFSSIPIPPRLTPSPQPQTSRTPSPPIHPSTPPLRKSIYPHPQYPTWHITVQPFSTLWPTQFTTIKNHLHTLFTTSTPAVPYQTIEHIGSTAIPDLAAKPNIDVLVTFAHESHLLLATESLNWEIPTSPPYARYTQVIPRGGGIPGRESFKLYLPEDNPYYAETPERSVYLIADVPGNEAGRVQIQCYRTVRDTLLEPRNRDLLDEYGEIKVKLGDEIFTDPLEYSARKDGIIRKILVRGGWTDDQVTRKEELTRRVWISNDEEVY